MGKNLILGTGTGYKFDKMKNFLDSLESIHFTGDIAIVVKDDIDNETKTELLKRNVNLYFINHKDLNFTKKYANSRLWKIHYLPHKIIHNLLNRGAKRFERLENYVKQFHLISGARFCYYYDYLAANKDKYEKVLLTDIRDVVFQADPFPDIKNAELNFYGEDHKINNFYTAYWIKNAFGVKAFEKIKEETILCAGTTMGATEKMLHYLRQMIITQASITAGLTGLDGFDQGVHNYLIYNGYFPGACLNANYEGQVATLGNASNMILNDAKELVNKRHQVIPVVHQYDRFPDLKLKVLGN